MIHQKYSKYNSFFQLGNGFFSSGIKVGPRPSRARPFIFHFLYRKIMGKTKGNGASQLKRKGKGERQHLRERRHLRDSV